MSHITFLNTLLRLDYRVISIILAFMAISLVTISAYSSQEGGEDGFWTPATLRQGKAFAVGWAVFLFFAHLDYNRLRDWIIPLYFLMILSLVGLFFTDSIQRVHRWYRLPFIGFNFQPSEFAKLIVVLFLSWFLERNRGNRAHLPTLLKALIIVGVPFILILQQPDLGTALILLPCTLVMFFFGGFYPRVVQFLGSFGLLLLFILALLFLKIIPHEAARPYATLFLKEYQFDRLNPDTHHQRAASIAIGAGGLFGEGYRKSTFSGAGWLPATYTDSVFPAFAEMYGVFGLILLLFLAYCLIQSCFQVSLVAKDFFGKLLSAGIAVLISMHIVINMGMMIGFLPITGVPLVLITYGGSSVFSTMMALGILQSVWIRRFMF